MTVMQSGAGLTLALLGNRVDRPAATLPATTNTAYFTIVGGRVMLTGLVGEVTTIVQTQTDNAKWIATPTVGTAVDICAVLNITASEVGALFSITGLITDALTGAPAVSGAVYGMTRQLILATGTLRFSCSATNTGATKWSAFWLPVDAGATLVVA